MGEEKGLSPVVHMGRSGRKASHCSYQLAQYFAGMWPHLDEHARRLVAASQAVELGYGGISRVSRACGLSRVTLTKGVEELQAAPLAPGRVRREAVDDTR